MADESTTPSNLPFDAPLYAAFDHQDVFISYARPDKDKYIAPIANSLRERNVPFWLDELQIAWGDNFPMAINIGMRTSRFVLVCLSKDYCKRPWPETELSTALALQNNDGLKRLLPLILNSKDTVLETYPLLASYSYREYNADPEAIVSEICALLQRPEPNLQITVQAVHSGKRFRLIVPPRASTFWVLKQVQTQFQVTPDADFGAFVPFRLRFVLVDSRAKEYWENLPRERQRELLVVVHSKDGIRESTSEADSFDELGATTDAVFNVYAIEDQPPQILYDPPCMA